MRYARDMEKFGVQPMGLRGMFVFDMKLIQIFLIMLDALLANYGATLSKEYPHLYFAICTMYWGTDGVRIGVCLPE